MAEIFNVERDYKNIEVYKNLIFKKDNSYIYSLLEHAVQNMSAKEFLDFSKQLEPVITEKRIWANVLKEVGFGRLPEDKESSETYSNTSNYHKNLARVSRLSEGADFSEYDKSNGFNPELEFDKKNIKSWGLTNKSKHDAEKYRSGAIKADRKAAEAIAKLKLMKDNQNA